MYIELFLIFNLDKPVVHFPKVVLAASQTLNVSYTRKDGIKTSIDEPIDFVTQNPYFDKWLDRWLEEVQKAKKESLK